MEAINYLYGALGLAYIVPFLFVLTIVVFFHELGHFYAARRCGVRVEVFSVGFGRAIASWDDKHGTEWKIGWLPLGGYVRMLDDHHSVVAKELRRECFTYQPSLAKLRLYWQDPWLTLYWQYYSIASLT